MSTDTIFNLRNLTQSYDGRTVLDIDQLDILAGEILAVVGPSGAGKSTLLRHLNFLERPASGSLAFDAFHLNGEGVPLDLRRKITTVFQSPVLLNRSVADNVLYGLKLRGKNGGQTRRVVNDTLDLVGLNDLTDARARNLSGGEAQRVALARALVIRPSVLLLDEPTANLDPYNVKLIENIITQVNRERGTTIVIVTHNTFQAKRLAHRTALLLEGRLVEIAETGAFFANPADPRTAAFINGEMVY